MKADYAALLARRQRDVPGASFVDAWDSGYYQEKVKAEQYNFDSQSVRPYFEYSRVKAGVWTSTSRMFGISYRQVKDAAVWHPDVEVYDVFEGSTAARPHLPRHVPARQQVQALCAVHAHQRQERPDAARRRARLQLSRARAPSRR